MRLLMIILPLGWAIIGVAVSAPLVLVLFGGILNAITDRCRDLHRLLVA